MSEKTTRADLLTLAKKRAHVYFDDGDPKNAALSLLSDFKDWSVYPEGNICYSILVTATMNPSIVDKKFIDGFN